VRLETRDTVTNVSWSITGDRKGLVRHALSITPRPRASAGFIATGKFSLSTCPVSRRSSRGNNGSGSPGFGGWIYASRDGHNADLTTEVALHF
jgi:hypothetical protein